MNKQYIIDEIKRTANENGGVPLGRERFRKETGIRESDWSGRHFVRWSDAIREAGFEPNELQRAYEADDLIAHLVIFIRELGHFPTQPELRLKRRQDATFPGHTLLSNKFGTKARIARRVVEFCIARPDLADVEVICAPIAVESEKGLEEIVDEAEPNFGFVYLIRSGKHYKIGRSNSAGRRQYELAIQLPEKAQKVHEIRTDDPVGIERYWHNRFAEKRKNGEWFELAAADITAFKRRKFM